MRIPESGQIGRIAVTSIGRAELAAGSNPRMTLLQDRLDLSSEVGERKIFVGLGIALAQRRQQRSGEARVFLCRRC